MATIRITKRAADEYIAKFDPPLASIVNVSDMATIRITKRAADEYIAKFDPQLASIVNVSERIKAASKDLIPVFEAARYISKNDTGKLYRSYALKIDMIVRDDAIVTLFPLRHALKSEKRLNHSKHPFEMERN